MTSDFDMFTLVPQYSDLKSREEANLRTALVTTIGIDIPIIASPMNTVTESKMAIKMGELGGIGFIHRYMTIEEQCKELCKVEHCNVGASISTNSRPRIDALIKAGVDALILDVAHGDTKACLDTIKYVKKNYGTSIISGNIVTANAALRLAEAEVDGLRVGIGAGSVCTTRMVAGVGRNQLKALATIKRIMNDSDYTIPILSCGGIRDSGDIVKALAAGASSVIIGRLFAPTDESPAPRANKDGKQVVVYGGMASTFAETLRAEKEGINPADIFHITTPEGKEEFLEVVGPVENVVKRLVGGIRAGMAYLGARTIPELQRKAFWETVDGRKAEL